MVSTDPLQTGSKEVTEARALNRVILDTLIRLKAKVPGDQLLPLFGVFPDEVVIVLAASLEMNRQTLLSLVGRPLSDTRWLAVCNLLASIQAEGFAASLLRDIHVKVSLYVSEDGLGQVGSGEGGGISSCGYSVMAKDFPSSALYELTRQFEEGDIMLADGPRRVFYRRRPIPMNQPIPMGVGTQASFDDRDLYRKEYLAQLLGKDTRSLAFDPRAVYAIRWLGSDGLRMQAKRIFELHRRSFWQLTAQLLEEGLLTSEEKETLTLKVSFAVHDLRKDKGTSLGIPASTEITISMPQ